MVLELIEGVHPRQHPQCNLVLQELSKLSARMHLGHDVIDIGDKASCVPQGVFVCNGCTDEVSIGLIFCSCSQICWSKYLHLQSTVKASQRSQCNKSREGAMSK